MKTVCATTRMRVGSTSTEQALQDGVVDTRAVKSLTCEKRAQCCKNLF